MGVFTAGVAVTGLLVWDGSDSTLRGEAIAALIAGKNEREAYAYHFEGDNLAFHSNSVSPRLDMSVFYNGVLTPTRDFVTESSPPVVWLDAETPLPAHGDSVLGVEIGVYVDYEREANGVLTRTWDYAYSNKYDVVPTTATRIYDPSVKYVTPLLGVTNNPVFGELISDFRPVFITNLYYQGGNWWTEQGLGTNVYAWSIEGTNGIVNYLLRTQILYEARTVLSELKRTATWLYPASVTCGVSTVRSYTMTNWPDMYLSGTSVTTNAAFHSECVHGTAYWRKNFSDEETSGGSAEVYRFTDCVLPYPSEVACASGKVSKVSVYAVCVPTYALSTSQNHETTNLYEEIAYTGISWQLEDVNDQTFGVVDYLCPLPASPQPFVNTSTEYDEVIFWLYGESPLGAFRVNLVGEYTSPSSRPRFDFGAESITFDETKAGGYDGTWKNRDTEEELSKSERVWEGGVEVYGFIVIVDWNWAYP